MLAALRGVTDLAEQVAARKDRRERETSRQADVHLKEMVKLIKETDDKARRRADSKTTILYNFLANKFRLYFRNMSDEESEKYVNDDPTEIRTQRAYDAWHKKIEEHFPDQYKDIINLDSENIPLISMHVAMEFEIAELVREAKLEQDSHDYKHLTFPLAQSAIIDAIVSGDYPTASTLREELVSSAPDHINQEVVKQQVSYVLVDMIKDKGNSEMLAKAVEAGLISAEQGRSIKPDVDAKDDKRRVTEDAKAKGQHGKIIDSATGPLVNAELSKVVSTASLLKKAIDEDDALLPSSKYELNAKMQDELMRVIEGKAVHRAVTLGKGEEALGIIDDVINNPELMKLLEGREKQLDIARANITSEYKSMKQLESRIGARLYKKAYMGAGGLWSLWESSIPEEGKGVNLIPPTKEAAKSYVTAQMGLLEDVYRKMLAEWESVKDPKSIEGATPEMKQFAQKHYLRERSMLISEYGNHIETNETLNEIFKDIGVGRSGKDSNPDGGEKGEREAQNDTG